MPTDFVALYATARDRFTGLVREVPESDFDRTVPGCPNWTARDLVAHVAGVAADVSTGVLPTTGIDEWTAAQVEKRRGVAVPDLLAEWASTGIEDAIPTLPGPFAGIVVVDLITHEHDLRAAVGRADRDDPATALPIRGYSRPLGAKIDEAGLPALRIEAGDLSFVAGSGEPGATVRGEPYEVFRALAGRRSEADVRALDWDGDPAPYLPIFSAFGALPATSAG